MDNPLPTPSVPAAIVTSVQSVPEEIKGWSWGGFLWSWIWAIGNHTWIGLLALIPIPGVALVMAVILGIKGREWAWENKQWGSVEEFKRVQRNWVKWWFIIALPLTLLAVVGMVTSMILVAINPSVQLQKARDTQIRQNYLQNLNDSGSN